MKKVWLLSVLALWSASCAVPAQATRLPIGRFSSGPAESPPNASPGIGIGIITIDDVANTMRVQVGFSGLVLDRHRHDGIAHPLLHGRSVHRHRGRGHGDADVPRLPARR